MKCKYSGTQLPVEDSRVEEVGLGGKIKCNCGRLVKVRLVGFGYNYDGPKGYLVPTHKNRGASVMSNSRLKWRLGVYEKEKD